jgi:hypothetical protein
MPKWRVFTWVIVVINVLFLVWFIAGVGSAGSNVKDCTGLTGQALDLCNAGNAGTAVGTGVGAAIIIFLWAFVDIIMGIVWLVTRPRGRPCPVCGTNVKPGVTVCPKCGHDFRGAVAPPATPPMPG